MSFSLLPKYRIQALTELTPDQLERLGVRLLMLDFDNTIVPYTTDTPSPAMQQWLQTMERSAITLCVVSNSKRDRVKVFCQQYGLACITHARKPFSKGIRECLLRYDIAPEHCALAGDQIFTDTLGANCAGICSIVVKPINNHNIFLKLRHVAERPLLFLARGRYLR